MMESHPKVLLVLDDAAIDGPLVKELESISCQLLHPVENIIQKVFDEVPHLIIVDEDFKGGDGRGIARSLKDDLVLKHIPIILIVQNKDRYLQDRQDEIDFYYQKGDDLKNLLECVRESLVEKSNELDVNPLTHLPGSRSSLTRVERAIETHKSLSICCVDLSDLSAFNHAYGDVRGDQVITKLGEIMQDVLKKRASKEDFLGHFGGDDFMIVTDSAAAVAISEAIIQEFDTAIPLLYDPKDRKRGYILQKDGEGFFSRYPIMSISIVIVSNENLPLSEISQISRIASELKAYMETLPGSCYMKYKPRPLPQNGESPSASVEVKFAGKNESVTVESPVNHEDKFSLFNSILGGKKIQSVYQPIIELKTRKIIGYEALTRSLVGNFLNDSATVFEMARAADKIKEFDQLCVDNALRNGQNLPKGRKLFLNINHETLIDPVVLKNFFSEKGVVGFDNIVIEVTEQSILRSFEKVREALVELKEQGACVAIDDLGGGAVSLRDVAILRPDYIKFDRSLVRQIDRNITKQQIIISLIIFSNSIGAVTTAEGIETRKEYETVMMCGVGLGQGYYFAKPVSSFILEIP